jgi:hypothetical protein
MHGAFFTLFTLFRLELGVRTQSMLQLEIPHGTDVKHQENSTHP